MPNYIALFFGNKALCTKHDVKNLCSLKAQEEKAMLREKSTVPESALKKLLHNAMYIQNTTITYY